jgi:hypothetical protein
MAEQVEKGHRTALELALAAWREVEDERRASQGDLFDDVAENLPEVVDGDGSEGAGARGRGRPLGSRNRRTDELSRWYIAQNDGRHPLQRGIEIAGLPILAKGVLEGLAERLGMSRADAAKFWANVLSTTLPYVAQRQAALEVRAPGAPGSGQPILWTLSEEGELIDATHDGDELRAITTGEATDIAC